MGPHRPRARPRRAGGTVPDHRRPRRRRHPVGLASRVAGRGCPLHGRRRSRRRRPLRRGARDGRARCARRPAAPAGGRPRGAGRLPPAAEPALRTRPLPGAPGCGARRDVHRERRPLRTPPGRRAGGLPHPADEPRERAQARRARHERVGRVLLDRRTASRSAWKTTGSAPRPVDSASIATRVDQATAYTIVGRRARADRALRGRGHHRDARARGTVRRERCTRGRSPGSDSPSRSSSRRCATTTACTGSTWRR